MAQRRHHYEAAFEGYLRARRVPYVAVDEARKALTPAGSLGAEGSLKSFDFVIYGQGANLLAEVKGRKLAPRARSRGPLVTVGAGSELLFRPVAAAPRMESWVTLEDVESLRSWQRLFGPEFEAAFVFVYWCDEQPADGLYHEVFEHHGRWYTLRAVRLDSYAAAMKPRSVRWGTVDLPRAAFDRLAMPFAPAGMSDSALLFDPGPQAPLLDPLG